MPEFREDVATAPKHTDEYKRTVLKCGFNGDHKVKIHRSKWPPSSMQGLNPALILEKPHLSAVCERCEANLIIYDPPPPGVTVVLYGRADEAHGTVVDNVGTVVDERPKPDEPEPDEEPEPAAQQRRR